MHNKDLPQGMDKSQATGQGLLKQNFGPDDDSVGEQLNALQQRGFKLAAKVRAMSINPDVPQDQTSIKPTQATVLPFAAMKLKGAKR